MATLAARKINQNTVIDPMCTYKRIWSFRTQRQMDLYINEMGGQISDGMWENSRGTDWLWNDGQDIYVLDESKPTTLTVVGGWGFERRKTNYPLTKSLIDCIEERIYTQNGFEYGDIKSLKAEWKEIADAIVNAKETGWTGELYEKLIVAPRNLREKAIRNTKEATYRYIQDNLSDLIKITTFGNDAYALRHLTSQVSHMIFDLKSNGKIEVKCIKGAATNTLVVDKEDVRETIGFLKRVVLKEA